MRPGTRAPSVRELLTFVQEHYAVTTVDVVRRFRLFVADNDSPMDEQVRLRREAKEAAARYLELAGCVEDGGAWSLPYAFEDAVEDAIAEWCRRHGPYADMPLDAYVEFAEKHGWDLRGVPSTREEIDNLARKYKFDGSRLFDLAAAASDDLGDVDWMQSLKRWMLEVSLAVEHFVHQRHGGRAPRDPIVWVWAAHKIAAGVKAAHVAEACGCSVRHMYRSIKDVPDPLPPLDEQHTADLELRLDGVRAREERKKAAKQLPLDEQPQPRT